MAKKKKTDVLENIKKQSELSIVRAAKAETKAKKERENAAKLDGDFQKYKTISNDFLSILFNCETEEEQAKIIKELKLLKREEDNPCEPEFETPLVNENTETESDVSAEKLSEDLLAGDYFSETDSSSLKNFGEAEEPE
jgi:hypothetical protein